MALDKPVHPKGSIILKILIVLLLGLLLTSILYPSYQWKQQNQQRDICRLRMENLLYVSREYASKTKTYTENLDQYLTFISDDSVWIDPPRYEIESLVRDESGKDSLMVDFTDEFHLSHLTVDNLRPDSIQVRAVPRPQFRNLPITTLILTCPSPISAVYREKNVTDHALLLYAGQRMNYQWIYPEPVLMKATEALISLPLDSLRECPTMHTPYKLHVNVRARLEGTVNFLVNKTPVDTNVTRDTLILDLLNHHIESVSLTDVMLAVQQDTALIPKRDSLLAATFHQKLAAVKPNRSFDVSGDYSINVPADSMPNWDNPLRIKRSVFVMHIDSLSQALKKFPDFQELASRISYNESYRVAKIDTVGITILCPIDSLYHEPGRSIIKDIFGVGPPKNHGQVVNGDLSWSEKR